MISLKNIASNGIHIPNNLSLIRRGASKADAIIGVKFGGWGISLEDASRIAKKTR